MKQPLLRVMLFFFLIVGVVCSQSDRTFKHTQAEGRPAGKQGTIRNSPNLSATTTQFGQGSETRMALKDESGIGSEKGRDARNLTINLKPCDGKANYMTFHKPYVEENVGEVSCEGQSVKLIAVTQQ